MRRLLQAIGILCAVVLAGAAGVVIVWLNSDPSTWRDALTRLASEQLGRQLTIAGELKPGFSFSQGLTLEIADLRLANAQGFAPADMLVLPKLEIAVDLRALLSNTIHIRGLKISGATLTLVQQNSGANNWTFRTPQRPTSNETPEPVAKTSDGRAFAFDADQVTADDLLVNYSAPGDMQTVQVRALALEAPADKPFTVQAELSRDQTAYAISFASGPLKALLDGTRQPLAVQVQTPLHKLALEATYSRHDALHRFDDLALQADRLLLKGEATVTMAEPRPRVTAKLTTPVLELPKAQPAASNDKADTNALPEPLFSRTPLPWALLSALDLDAVVSVDRVTRGNVPLGPLHVDAQLAQARMLATVIAQPPGAAQPVKLDLVANAQQQASVTLAAPALDPSLWASVLGDRPLVQSPASVALSLSGRGVALHDLAATASGTIAFAAQPGTLNAAAIPDTARRALDAVLGADALNKAALACLKAGFTVQDGVMRASGGGDKGIGLDSNVIAVSGDGQADLGAETIALRLVAAPKLPGLGQTLIPLHITGALGDPRVSADLAAAAGQVAGQLVGKLAETLPSARIGLATAKAMGKDPTAMIQQPYNPCIAATPAAAPVATPDPVTAPSRLPPEVKEKLKGARDMLDQFIKAAEPPPAAAPAEPAAVPETTPEAVPQWRSP